MTEDGNVIISSTLNSITVQSTLRRTAVTETEIGPVSCVVYHSFGGDLFLATSTSNLVILSEYRCYEVVSRNPLLFHISILHVSMLTYLVHVPDTGYYVVGVSRRSFCPVIVIFGLEGVH